MRTVALVALACFGVASGDPVPTPTPAPDKYAPRSMGAKPPEVLPNQGLGTSAGAIKLKKGVSFDLKSVPPEPPYKARTPQGCDAGPFKNSARSAMSAFDDHARVAGQTPRIALQGAIAKLVDLKQAWVAEKAKAPSCMAPVYNMGALYQISKIEAFTAFMGKEESEAAGMLAGSEVARQAYEAEFAQIR